MILWVSRMFNSKHILKFIDMHMRYNHNQKGKIIPTYLSHECKTNKKNYNCGHLLEHYLTKNRVSWTMKLCICLLETFCRPVVTFSDSVDIVAVFFYGVLSKLQDFED